MELLPDNQAVTFVKSGIIWINTLRNKVIHQLDVKFTHKDLGEITRILKIARMNVEDLSFIANIKKISVLVLDLPFIFDIFSLFTNI